MMVTLAKRAIAYNRVSFLLLALVLLLGGISLKLMPKAEDPQFELPLSVVEVLAPGLSTQDMEVQVVNPIEDAFSLLEDVDSIETTIKQGSVTFEVRFLYGVEPDAGFDEVVRAVGRVRASLPSQIKGILYFKAAPTTVNIFQIALSSTQNDYVLLERHAKRLQRRLQAIKGINKAELWGVPEQVVKVALMPHKLQAHQLSLAHIQQALSARGTYRSASYIDTQQRRYHIELSGKFESLAAIRNTLIPAIGSEPVRLGDIAHIDYASYQPDYLAYLNQIPSVFVTLQQRSGSNIFDIKQQVQEQLDSFAKQLDGSGIQMKVIFDQSEGVKHRVGGFLNNLWFGLGLILAALLVFIGLREAIIVALTIPLSIGLALVLLDSLGFAFQQMTIAGLIIALGLLVDNALVMVEATTQKLRHNGNKIKDAALAAVKDVAWPITSGTLTTVFAFLPLLLLQSDTGDFMRGLPVSVSLVLISSLIFATVFLPALMVALRIQHQGRWNLQRTLNGLARTVYSPLLSSLTRWPWLTVAAGLGLAALFASLFPKVGVSLFPKAEKQIVVVNVETNPATSLTHTRELAFSISRELSQLPGVQHIVENVGASNPRIYYNHVARRGEPYFAQLMLFMDNYNPSTIEDTISKVQSRYQDEGEVKVNVYEFQQGPVTDRPITFRIMGDDLAQLRDYGAKLAEFLKQLDGTRDVRNVSSQNNTKLAIRIDEFKALNAGLSLSALEQQLSLLLEGQRLGSLDDSFGEDFSIILTQSEAELQHLLRNTYVYHPQGESLPLSAVANIHTIAGTPPFFHYQRTRMVKVSADFSPGYNVKALTEQAQAFLDRQQWKGGIYYLTGGEEAARQKSFGGLSQIMLLAAGGIFTILVLQFNSLRQPLIIFSILPLAITGAIVGLYLTGHSFSLMAFIGVISLLGIVVNDSIIMVDTFNRQRHQHENRKAAMIEAASSRFTPIIFTSLTTILGLLPLTLYGGALWEPMGWVIITGLIFSTLTCLLFVPAVSLLLSRR
ncbi:Nodulation protein NolG [Saliniradius amylolyticus]|uniref:Nodulation protein NolG n=1 Tax=Saliniradius amylolyticus TaxID=2183582 RepID=A0A2S2E1Z9_9ALTE|nr:efflux RND transporter permease subunit [Saliniradius amylolyticus]AWL11675.1 Nodulation protein NolG [Saliniradius amylolyticus]